MSKIQDIHIPEGWKYSVLGKEGCFLKGGGFAKKDILRKGLPCITYGEIYTKHSYVIKEHFSYINGNKAKQSTRVHTGDILFAGSGETVEDIGKNVAYTLDDKLYAGGDVVIFRGNKNNSVYLSYVLNTDDCLRQKMRLGQGSSVIHIYPKHLTNISFLKPEREEQNKIAEVLSSVDDAIEKTDKLIEKYKKIKTGLMEDLFTKGIDVNTGKAHTKLKDSELGKIPESWELKAFKDICKVRQGLQIPISNRYKEQTKDKTRYKYITIQSLKDTDNIEWIDNPPKSVIFTKRDLLFTRTGNTGMIVKDEEGVFHNNFFLMDYDEKKVERMYLYYYLHLPKVKNEILIKAGTTTIPDLKHGDFYSTKIIYPSSLLEQKEIVDIITKADNKVNKEVQYRKKLEKVKKGLMNDLLTGKVRVKY